MKGLQKVKCFLALFENIKGEIRWPNDRVNQEINK